MSAPGEQPFDGQQPEQSPEPREPRDAGAPGAPGPGPSGEAAGAGPDGGLGAAETDPVAGGPGPEDVGAGDLAGQAAADEVALARAELAERTLDLQRLQAEFLNYKRRVDRDRDLVRENATFSVLSSLLPVLDDIDRAREHGEVEGGFKAVADSLDRVVGGLGLTKYAAKGDPFDPTLHEALMHGHSSEVTTTTVDVVAQAGYRIGDRVVRAAKVTVLDPEQPA
ncbi:MAG: GrpE protein cofactor [Marmoricola sp.]|nr:GrpE protein cofactor [Marmoricola sp.]